MASTKLILIIDDNVDAADLTAEVLRMQGLRVQVAYGGQEGLAVARVVLPDVVFLDIGMPFMDGYEVARALRRDTALKQMKIRRFNDLGRRAVQGKKRGGRVRSSPHQASALRGAD